MAQKQSKPRGRPKPLETQKQVRVHYADYKRLHNSITPNSELQSETIKVYSAKVGGVVDKAVMPQVKIYDSDHTTIMAMAKQQGISIADTIQKILPDIIPVPDNLPATIPNAVHEILAAYTNKQRVSA